MTRVGIKFDHERNLWLQKHPKLCFKACVFRDSHEFLKAYSGSS